MTSTDLLLLGVNIDHVATLRQARGTRYPDPVQAAFEAEEAHHLMSHLNFGDAASQDVRGAVQHLQATGTSRSGMSG